MEFVDVPVERLDLKARDRVRDAFGAVGRGDVVVGRGHHGFDPPRLAMRDLEALERLRARDLMDEVAVDVKQPSPVRFFADEVRGPELFVEGARGHGSAEAKLKL